VSFAAQHLHGGMGVDVDYPLHRYCLWAKQLELTLGSSIDEIDRLGARLAACSERTRSCDDRDPDRHRARRRPTSSAAR
jgi:hypothetical protein